MESIYEDIAYNQGKELEVLRKRIEDLEAANHILRHPKYDVWIKIGDQVKEFLDCHSDIMIYPNGERHYKIGEDFYILEQ